MKDREPVLGIHHSSAAWLKPKTLFVECLNDPVEQKLRMRGDDTEVSPGADLVLVVSSRSGSTPGIACVFIPISSRSAPSCTGITSLGRLVFIGIIVELGDTALWLVLLEKVGNLLISLEEQVHQSGAKVHVAIIEE